MAEINKIRVSELKTEENGNGYWLFGYRDVGGKQESRKFSFEKLKEVVEKAADSIQLERRIAVVFERNQQLVPIGEKMTIKKVEAKNVTSLKYKLNVTGSNLVEIPLNVELSKNQQIVLDGKFDMVLDITNPSEGVGSGNYEKYSTITIFATAETK